LSMKLGLHFCLVLIIIICVSLLDVTNSLIQKKGTTFKNRLSKNYAKWNTIGKKQSWSVLRKKKTDKSSLRSKIKKAKTVIANKLTRHVPLNRKEKRFLRKLMARDQQYRNASSNVGADYGNSLDNIHETDLESSEAMDGVGDSMEIDKLFKGWNVKQPRAELRPKITPWSGSPRNSPISPLPDSPDQDEDVLRITPAPGPIINTEDFSKLKAEAEQILIQSGTLNKNGGNPWVQITDDSIDLAQITTLETTMHNIWQKESKTDCGVEDKSEANHKTLEKCTKAMIEIDEFLATPSDGADYKMDLDYFNKQETKDTYCKIKAAKCEDLVFSRLDGWCNNLNNPDWGGKNIPYRRLLKHNFYKEHISEPFSEADGLPIPFDVSQKLMMNEKEDLSWNKESEIVDPDLSQVFMQFGQFLAHDITQAAFKDDDRKKSCNTKEPSKFCRTFATLSKDKFFFSSLRINANVCAEQKDSVVIVTEQVNGFSAFIDATGVYAESKDSEQKKCRGKHGKMVTEECGERRCIASPLLRACHYLFVAEHNRIVKGLIEAGMNLERDYDGMKGEELIYQIARKIVIAEIQSIVYGDWLPLLIGPTYMKKFELDVKSNASIYDPRVNPGLYNEFTTAALRFGHSAVPGLFNSRGPMEHLLNTHLLKTKVAGKNPAINYPQILDGAALSPMEKIDPIITNHMRSKEASFIGGSDIAAMNIARGRDHGLPPYYKVRNHFHLSPEYDESQFEPDVLAKLKDLYREARYFGRGELHIGPAVADLWVAGLAEKHTPGGKVGETFASIIGQQFHNLKYGDRYFFTHTKANNGRGLPSKLRKMIRERTLSNIICENSYPEFKIKEDVFRYNSKPVTCGSLGHDLDFGQIISELGYQ